MSSRARRPSCSTRSSPRRVRATQHTRIGKESTGCRTTTWFSPLRISAWDAESRLWVGSEKWNRDSCWKRYERGKKLAGRQPKAVKLKHAAYVENSR
jgi:hypothetical protein